MSSSSDKKGGQPASIDPRSSILDGVLRIGLVALLVYACVRILIPFASVLLWSAILAVMLYPLHRRLSARMGNRLSAMLIGGSGVLVLSVPLVIALTSLSSSIFHFVEGLNNHSIVIPPPPEALGSVPVVGKKLSNFWTLAATNTPAAIAKYGPQLQTFGASMAKFGSGVLGSGVSFIASLVIAAILIAYAQPGVAFAQRLFFRITADKSRASRLLDLTVATIRGVALGVLGVAMVQAALVGIGFFAIGLPGAGLLTLLVLLLGIAQIPGGVVALPAIAYVFTKEPTSTALIFGAWTFVAGASDNILKPFMLGRGLEVPMPVILLGVLGGMIADGLLGLFIGPVVLAVGYLLFLDWVEHSGNSTAAAE